MQALTTTSKLSEHLFRRHFYYFLSPWRTQMSRSSFLHMYCCFLTFRDMKKEKKKFFRSRSLCSSAAVGGRTDTEWDCVNASANTVLKWPLIHYCTVTENKQTGAKANMQRPHHDLLYAAFNSQGSRSLTINQQPWLYFEIQSMEILPTSDRTNYMLGALMSFRYSTFSGVLFWL